MYLYTHNLYSCIIYVAYIQIPLSLKSNLGLSSFPLEKDSPWGMTDQGSQFCHPEFSWFLFSVGWGGGWSSHSWEPALEKEERCCCQLLQSSSILNPQNLALIPSEAPTLLLSPSNHPPEQASGRKWKGSTQKRDKSSDPETELWDLGASVLGLGDLANSPSDSRERGTIIF